MQRTGVPMQEESELLGGCMHIMCRMGRDGSSGIRKMQENAVGCAWLHEAFKGRGKKPKISHEGA